MRIGIIGAGPAGLMTLKRLVESNLGSDSQKVSIDIYEASATAGSGMPYSDAGASREHITNVSSDELPDLTRSLEEWVLAQPDDLLAKFDIERENFHEKMVVPRLLFGHYLKAQFDLLCKKGRERGLEINVHLERPVKDIIDSPETHEVVIEADGSAAFDHVVLCTGHDWPSTHEGKVDGYFDSPYPPSKLAGIRDHKVVIRGSSLTAVDAVKTIALANGRFFWKGKKYCFERSDESANFAIEMHSRDGLLPSVRIHMEEPHVDSRTLLPEEQIASNIKENGGFLSLDFVFEEAFKKPLEESSPAFYATVKDMSVEDFVARMLTYREEHDAFELLAKEYQQSLESINDEKAVPWKEMLAALSFAMNYPAKHFSAEDMLRLRKHLSPLISVVIAFLPQSSAELLLALHDAGCLDLVADGEGGSVDIEDGKIVYTVERDGKVEKQICETFIDCIGQKHFDIEDFPFASLVSKGTVCGARLKFRSATRALELLDDEKTANDIIEEDGEYFLKVPGLAISDEFAVIGADRKAGHTKENSRLFVLAVPYIGGFNPDYSGLDFCEQASKRVVKRLEKQKTRV